MALQEKQGSSPGAGLSADLARLCILHRAVAEQMPFLAFGLAVVLFQSPQMDILSALTTPAVT